MAKSKSSGQKNKAQGDKDAGTDAPQEHRKPGTAEWIVGTISGLLVLTGIGFLSHEALTDTSRPPLVVVEPTNVLEYEQGYVVEFSAYNSGGLSARALSIQGRLLESRGGKEVEKSSAALTWLPANARRKGGLFFSRDPRKYHLELTPVGYERP